MEESSVELLDFLLLCLLVKVPELLQFIGLEAKAVPSVSSRVSPTSLSCLVMLVKGKLGFIDGFLLIVPMGNSESNAFSQLEGAPSDIQPLELELLARLCLPELDSLGAE